jgi:hypothetical protein
MWRIPLLAIATCLTLQASSMVTYNCTIGTTTANPCPETSFGLALGLTNPPFDNAHASAFAQVSEPTLANIAVHAATSLFYDGCSVTSCPEPPLSTSAQAILNDSDYTTGSVRSGFIQVSETIFSLHGNPEAATWSISDGSHNYSGCLPGSSGVEGCSGMATLPFELGVPFMVSASAINGFSIAPRQTGFGTDSEVDLTFTVLEADGSTPVAVLPTPEPSTYALLSIGLGLLPVVLLARRVAGRCPY